MVGLLQTPPVLQKNPYEVGIQPDPEPRKKRKITHSASFVKAKKRYLYNDKNEQDKSALNRPALASGRKSKADSEMEEAAEALLSVSPLLQPKLVDSSTAIKSPLSFLCNVLCSLGPASEDNSVKFSKGSLVQSLNENVNAGQQLDAMPKSMFLGKEFGNDISVNNTAAISILSSKEKRIGIYTPKARRQRIQEFLAKRQKRVWVKKVRYSCRKNLADGRVRIKGRFVSTKN